MKCPFLENHACIRADGQYRFCCISLEPDNSETVFSHLPQEWLNSNTVEEARQTLAGGEWPSACKKCKDAEERGEKSKRQSWQPESNEIEYLDLRFGNQCNLQCQMCFPGSSSSLVDEHNEILREGLKSPWGEYTWRKYNWFDTNRVQELLEQCQPSEIYLTGGEPFMVKGLPEFLEMLDSSVHVRFNTNASLYNPKLRQRLEKFNTVTITASIDGVGSINEYIRWGSCWETVEYNVHKFQEFANVNISPTIQVLNSLHYGELKGWADDNDLTIYQNVLQYPYYHSVKNMPDSVKSRVHPDIQRYTEGEGDNTEINKFLYYTRILDKSRGTNILDYLPELGELYGFT